MKYKVTLNNRTYEVEVEQGQAMSLQEQVAEIVYGAKRKPKRDYNF